jgi:hypothetical protein
MRIDNGLVNKCALKVASAILDDIDKSMTNAGGRYNCAEKVSMIARQHELTDAETAAVVECLPWALNAVEISEEREWRI